MEKELILADTYEAEVEYVIDNGPQQSPSCCVSILAGDVKIGEYKRNVETLDNTFFAFRSPYNGKDYALYSSDFTATRIMELPGCLDIGGEEPDIDGFCPEDYLVPWDGERFYPFGFVAGHEIDDDLTSKIQFLDLSRVHEGIIIRDNRFGYIELPFSMLLDEAISVYGETVSMTIEVAFDVETGNVL